MDLTQSIKDFLEAENKRDWRTVESYLADECTYQLVGSSEVIRGKRAYINKMQKTYEQIPDWRFDIKEIFYSQNGVAVEFDGTGHFTGDYMGKRYGNVPLRLQAICIFVFKGDKIFSEREYWDPEGFEKQLGR